MSRLYIGGNGGDIWNKLHRKREKKKGLNVRNFYIIRHRLTCFTKEKENKLDLRMHSFTRHSYLFLSRLFVIIYLVDNKNVKCTHVY